MRQREQRQGIGIISLRKKQKKSKKSKSFLRQTPNGLDMAESKIAILSSDYPRSFEIEIVRETGYV